MRYTLKEGAYPPVRAHETDAGADLRTPEHVVIWRNDQAIIDTGVSLEIPPSMFGWVTDKSSLAAKGLSVRGGIIDSPYRGTIKVIIENHNNVPYQFDAGDKIAQIIFIPCVQCDFDQVPQLRETERGEAGFGSTGK